MGAFIFKREIQQIDTLTWLECQLSLLHWADLTWKKQIANQAHSYLTPLKIVDADPYVKIHHIKIISPFLRREKSVQIKSWLSNAGRTSFEFSFEFVVEEKLVAQCRTLRVYTRNGKPVEIPNSQSLKEHLAPPVLKVIKPTIKRPQNAFYYQTIIRWNEAGGLIHMHNAKILTLFDEANYQFHKIHPQQIQQSQAKGKDEEKEKSSIRAQLTAYSVSQYQKFPQIREIYLDYIAPISFGDVLNIYVWPLQCQFGANPNAKVNEESWGNICFEITKQIDGAILARACAQTVDFAKL